jgi:hypothetical protein
MALQASTNLAKPLEVQFGISASRSAALAEFSEAPFVDGAWPKWLPVS